MSYLKEIENSNTVVVVLEDFEPQLEVEVEYNPKDHTVDIMDMHMYGYKLGMDHQGEICSRFYNKIVGTALDLIEENLEKY